MLRACKSLIFVCITVVGLAADTVVYSQPAAAAGNDADAVRAASKDFQRAARHGDGNALQKMWTPDGEYVDANGRVLKSGDLIGRLAATPRVDSDPIAESVSETTVRFVTPDVAIESGKLDCLHAPEGGLLDRRFTALWVKRDRKWLLDSLYESMAGELPFNEHLKPLEFLLGEWVGTTDNAAILVSSHWGGEGNYILREFAFARDGGETVLGTQRIGWDPVGGRIKSWTFDSQGGTGEEVWRRDGQRWLVDTVDVSPDGKQGKTSTVYVPGGEHSYTWEAANAEVAGVKLKPLRVEFHRAARSK